MSILLHLSWLRSFCLLRLTVSKRLPFFSYSFAKLRSVHQALIDHFWFSLFHYHLSTDNFPFDAPTMYCKEPHFLVTSNGGTILCHHGAILIKQRALPFIHAEFQLSIETTWVRLIFRSTLISLIGFVFCFQMICLRLSFLLSFLQLKNME